MVPQDDVDEPAVLGGPLSPVGWSVGFVEAPCDVVVHRLLAWRRRLGANLKVRRRLPPWPGCLTRLEPLSAPWTTEMLVAHGTRWTIYLNNDLGGDDPWPATSHTANGLGVRWVIATHQPMTRVGHASTQLWLGGPDGTPPLMYQRTIAAHAEDGRWSWHTTGDPLPFEQPTAYHARRIRDRFTRPMLVDYLRALGIEVDQISRYGNATLVRQRVRWPTRQQTIEQARRATGS